MAASKKTPEKALAETEQGKLLQNLLLENGAIDVAVLQKLAATAGAKVVAQGLAAARYSRIEKQRQWQTAKGVSKEEKATIKSLPEVLGSAPTILSQEEAREFSQAEVDALIAEELARRQTEDILKGRYTAIRSTALNLVTFLDKDNDPFACGTLTSPALGYKMTVFKRESGGDPDFSALEGILPPKVWNSITEEVTTRQVNDDLLDEALAKGTITMEQFASIVPDKSTSRVLRVDPIKEGDAL